MGNKVGKQYAINTEEFCALDYLSKKKYLLQETRSDIYKKIDNMWNQADKIEIVNGIYPETFVNNSRKDIFESCDLPGFIPVEVLRETKHNSYICRELLTCRYKFIIPDSVLTTRFDNMMQMIDLDLFINAHGITSIKACMDLFFGEINPPQAVKRRIKKDTK